MSPKCFVKTSREGCDSRGAASVSERTVQVAHEDDDDISGLIDEVYAVRQLLQDALGREDALRTQIGTLGHTLSARNAAHEALQATLSETAAALDQCKDTIRELQRQIEVKDAALERLLAHKDAVQALANALNQVASPPGA
ncbi:hypothetical protein B0H21DRAFT_828470 [Amylocystis lapponica]|nr:hypothetical protein B0H21DRAFT_828470 [Amylocystis lapponica]